MGNTGMVWAAEALIAEALSREPRLIEIEKFFPGLWAHDAIMATAVRIADASPKRDREEAAVWGAVLEMAYQARKAAVGRWDEIKWHLCFCQLTPERREERLQVEVLIGMADAAAENARGHLAVIFVAAKQGENGVMKQQRKMQKVVRLAENVSPEMAAYYLSLIPKGVVERCSAQQLVTLIEEMNYIQKSNIAGVEYRVARILGVERARLWEVLEAIVAERRVKEEK